MSEQAAAIPHTDEAVDLTARLMILTSLVFLPIGMLAGATLSMKLLAPSMGEIFFLSFGRLRAFHTNVVLFGWLLQAGMGLIYYMVPRLCNTRLFSEKMGIATWLIFNVAVLGGGVGLLLGYTKGIEYAELGVPFDVLVTVAWVLLVLNIVLTIARRRVKYMYVALWYVLGALVWTTVVYICGNFATRFTTGLTQANIAFFYMHNAVGLIFTPIGLAAAYYFIPKSVNTPLYSHTLSIFGFWIIAFVYVWTGAHHMLFGPASHWLQTVSILFSFSLVVPVAIVITNFYGTYAPVMRKALANVEAKFLLGGATFYLLTCLQGPAHAARSLNQIISKTDWIVGHAHMAVTGAFTFIAIAGIYYAVPRIFRRPLFSNRLGELHFWITFLAIIPFFLSLMVGGFLQGLSWMDPSISWVETIDIVRPYWGIRLASGTIILLAQLIFIVNIAMTVWPAGQAIPERGTAALPTGAVEA
jgi:cytochrome c oxidase cbb3-type subunit I